MQMQKKSKIFAMRYLYTQQIFPICSDEKQKWITITGGFQNVSQKDAN